MGNGNQQTYVTVTRYRAVNEQGTIISEGTDLEEVLLMSRGEATDILVQTERVVVSLWQQMPKHELSRWRKVYLQ